jgi:hypothetical protein
MKRLRFLVPVILKIRESGNDFFLAEIKTDKERRGS